MLMRMAVCPRLSSKKHLVKNFPYHAAKHRGKAVPVFLEPISALIIHALISAAIAMPALLIGHLEQGDIIKDAQQKSWKSPEISLF